MEGERLEGGGETVEGGGERVEGGGERVGGERMRCMLASSSACMAPTFRSGSASGFGGDEPCLAAFPCVKACSCSLFATSSDASVRSFCSGEGRGGESGICYGIDGHGPGPRARLQLEEEGEVFDARVQEAVHQLGLAEGLELVRDLVRERREHHGCQDVQAW